MSARGRQANWPLRVGLLVAVLFVFIGGIVFLSKINSGQTTPGPQTFAAPGTDPGDGDTATGGQGQPVDGVSCDRGEQLAFHVHAHVFILKDGVRQPVSANIGIPGAPLPRCFYWLHTHDRTGAIHMEAPSQRAFTLGQFFDVWGQPLGGSRVALIDVPPGQLAVFVDGHPYPGDPRQLQLKAHAQVVIEIGRQVTPPTFEFGSL